MRNTDLLAGLGALIALVAIGVVRIYTGEEPVSQDLQVALGTFVVAALTRWRLGLRGAAQEPSEPPAPSDTPTEDAPSPGASGSPDDEEGSR